VFEPNKNPLEIELSHINLTQHEIEQE